MSSLPVPPNDRVYGLLCLCTRAEHNEFQYPKLAQAVEQANWSGVMPTVEAQGMAPLLYFHLKSASIVVPPDVKRELQGLTVRHRQANQVRAHALQKILVAFDAAGILALVLKGAVLSHLIYPDPALRPMSDLDLLVPEADLARASKVLAGLGFAVPSSNDSSTHRHLSAARLEVEGISVQVELHHRLFSNYFDNARAYMRRRFAVPTDTSLKRQFSDLTVPPRSFVLGDVTAYTLGHEDMLRHLTRHLISHVNAWDGGRLIWVVDIVSFVERFVAEIDWERIRKQSPSVLDTLSLVHSTSPFSDEVLNQTALKIGRAPQGLGVAYRGWPQARYATWRSRGFRRVLHDTLLPSEWWLRLHYNVGTTRSLIWYRWVRHPLYLAGHIVRTGLERLGWPTAFELAGQ